MRVFLTGATGFVGSAIVPELLNAGHQVTGLARSDAAAASLAAAGATAHRGSLEDPDSLRRGAEVADGVIHCAFNHDFFRGRGGSFTESSEQERQAIEALVGALAGSDRPLLTTSGVALLAPGRLATEDDALPTNLPIPRDPETATAAAAARGTRASVVRLSPSVHGDGDVGFVPALIGTARAKGVSAYIGEGLNRWPAVHRLDAARLYRLALEQGSAGVRWHGVAEEGVPIREIAQVIGRRLNLPIVSISPEEAAEHFGAMAYFVTMDALVSSAQTRERLGWEPARPGLLEDLEQGTYFNL